MAWGNSPAISMNDKIRILRLSGEENEAASLI
jgi:hypothetical protein